MKKKNLLMLLIVSISTISLSTQVVHAQSLHFDSDLIVQDENQPNNIKRIWIEMHPVPGNGPNVYYYRYGGFHGYLQKVGYMPAGKMSFSYYSGYLYPLKSPVPAPAKYIEKK